MSSTLFRSCFPYHANITIKNKSAIKNIIPNPLIIEILIALVIALDILYFSNIVIRIIITLFKIISNINALVADFLIFNQNNHQLAYFYM
mgnify:CR=1 FL=1